MTRKILLFLSVALLPFTINCQNDSKIRLLVRGDDIGSFHSANLACIKSYTHGIMRSVEVMVPCPWYPEAVQMLNENPGLDVGIHLVLTSEWETMKWRPLTGFSSISDSSGYFYPMVWPNNNFPSYRTIHGSKWNLSDIEKELRAQIELALKDIRNVSHISTHMGFPSADPSIEELVANLAAEYKLGYSYREHFKRMEMVKPFSSKYKDREAAFIKSIEKLEPGTYLFVEHPALNTPELESIGHKGYENVGYDREGVTYVFTSRKVMKAIEKKGIELIGYGDLE